MMEQSEQLQLFEATNVAPRRLKPMSRMSLRCDHAVLLMIGGLIACSAVFALGIERGKQLARAEQPLLDSHARLRSELSTPEASPTSQAASASPIARQKLQRQAEPPLSTGPAESTPGTAPAQKATPSSKTPRIKTKLAAASSSQFAVQVVSYTQATLADRELQRLKQQGEPAFLATNQGRVSLLVGPFSNKAHASSKLTDLRQRYQDCFVRSL